MDSEIFIEQVTTFSSEIAEAIKLLVPQIGNNYKPITDDEIKEMISSSCNNLFFARERSTQKIVGMVTLLIYRIPYVKKSSLEDLIVDEQYRGKGIGTLLLHTIVQYAKTQNVAYIDFTSRPRRAEGNLFYEKMGFAKRETNVYRLVIDYGEV